MKKSYSKERPLVMKGVCGILEGESYCVCFGQTATVGRSAGCDISLKKCRRFVEAGGKGYLKDKSFRKVSRKHFRISYCHANLVEIEDLSRNGTFLNGNRIDKVMITDLNKREYRISFGEKETLSLSYGSG